MIKKIIYVFNKFDIASPDRKLKVKHYPRVFVSALTGQGMDQLKQLMADSVLEMQKSVQLFFPKSSEYKIFDLDRDTRIARKEAATEGTACYASLTTQQINKWKE